MKIIDLSHTFADLMPVYPGDPEARLRMFGSVDEAGQCPMFEVTTGMHVGTHLDAPLHMIPNGDALADLAPHRFFGRGVLIDARGRQEIDVDLIDNIELQPGDIVLVCTGFSKRFREPEYYEEYPVVTEAFANALVTARVNLLGLDTPGPDHSPYLIHRILLSAGVLIAENLTHLDLLIGVHDFEVIALPIKFQAEAAPARIVARINDSEAL